MFRWALDVGLHGRGLAARGKRPGRALAREHALADRLVFQKLRALSAAGSASSSPGPRRSRAEVAEFFHAMGSSILEGYGLTESSAATFVNLPWASEVRDGGPGARRASRCRIAEDGEILMRGPRIMRGYRGLPEQTHEALDVDGWLHTGDIGHVDSDGSSPSPTARRTSSRPPAGSTSRRRARGALKASART